MPMASLLSHFGINKARYVTNTGEIVFDGVTATSAGGYTHTTAGPVTQVSSHKFHGGDEEPDDGTENSTNWWDDPAAIGRHTGAMEAAFPGFNYLPADDDSGPCWGGVIDTGRGAFEVGIFLRRDNGLPTVVVFNKRLGAQAGRHWRKPPHLYVNGNLCVAEQGDWDPDRDTVATVVGWTAHWLAAYTEWRISRRWPVDGVQNVA